MDKRLDYQLTEWVGDELELSTHMRQLHKYNTPFELREQDDMVAIFIETPSHEKV